VLVTAAVLASAVLHACWNALAHRSADATVAVTLISIGFAACSVPILLAGPPPAAASRPYLALSAVLHVTYTVLLARGYSLGDFGQVYPLARGSAPLVVAFLAVVLAGERLSWPLLAGVGTVCGGLAVLATGALLGIGMLGYALLVFRLMNGQSLPAVLRERWWLALLGGALGWASYALVLWAQTRGALAAVAALRETGVIVAAVLGAVFFGERFGRRRIVATVLVATGVVLLHF